MRLGNVKGICAVWLTLLDPCQISPTSLNKPEFPLSQHGLLLLDSKHTHKKKIFVQIDFLWKLYISHCKTCEIIYVSVSDDAQSQLPFDDLDEGTPVERSMKIWLR